MKRLVVALVLLAGCSGTVSHEDTTAREAADASIGSVRDEFDYLLFLGITGTEGPLNWTAYESALQTASDPGRSIADAFDQDVDNGDRGDGRLGSWLTTHFVYDEDRQLLGGLYTQYAAGQVVGSVYAPFRGPYVGTPQLPALQPDTGRLLLQEGSMLCGIVSDVDSWHVDSEQAAQIALARPMMQAHAEAFPDAEFTYYYFPHLDVEAGCEAELDAPSNYWVISHVDLDEYLAGGMPTVAEVRIDAATGEVLAEVVRPLYAKASVTTDLSIGLQDELIPVRGTHNTSLVVEPTVTTLDIQVEREAAPQAEREAGTRLIDPTGQVWDAHAFSRSSHAYRVTAPTPGKWTIAYDHHGLEPEGDHALAIRAVAHYQ